MSCKTLSTYYPFPASDLIKDRCVKKEILKLIKSQGGGGGSPSGPAGGSLSGTYPNPSIANSAVDNSQISNRAALSVMGRSANSAGVVADITAGTDGHVLRRSGTTLGFGTIATAGITDQAVTYAKIQNSVGLSVLGRSANSTGVHAAITAATDNTILRRSGTSIGFGTIGDDYITDLDAGKITTGTLPIARGGTGLSTLGTANQQMRVNAGGTALEYFTPSGGGGGQVDSITAGTGIDVNATDPVNPEVSLDSATQASLLLANTALQSGDNISELTNDSNFIDTTAGDARYLKVGGNSIGAALPFGTNDNQQIDVRLNNAVRFRFHNWFSQYGVMHPTQNSGMVFANNQVKYPSTGNHVWYANGSGSTNVMKYDQNGLAIGYSDGISAGNKLQVTGNTLLENGSVLAKGASSTTGYVARFENSAGNVGLQVDNNLSVGIGKAPADGFILDITGGRSTGTLMRLQNTSATGISGMSMLSNGGITVGYLGYGNASSPIFSGSLVFNSTATLPLVLATGGVPKIELTTGGEVKVNTLAGTGTGVVTADDGGELSIERPPASGTYILKSVNGVIQWVAE